MSICLTISDEVSDNSWKISIPKYNGLGTEGIGSVYQYQILLAFYSDFIGVDYTFSGSRNLSHHSYTQYSEEKYCELLDKFFNLSNIQKKWDKVHMFAELQNTYDPRGSSIFNGELTSFIEEHKNTSDNILVNLHWCHLWMLNFCEQHVDKIFTKQRIDHIRNNLIFSDTKYFDDGINICWHIRTPNPNDVPQEIVSPLRELYVKENDFPRYKNLIDFLINNINQKKATLHIHSQGFTNDFSEFLELQSDTFKIQLHIDDDPISDIYHMANADLLIMSNSSFSWIASLLNSNQKIVRDNFTNGSFVHNALRANYTYTKII